MRLLTLLWIAFSLAFAVQAQEIKGHYAIKNVKTGMLLRVKDASNKNGTPLVAYDPQNWKCMTWEFLHQEQNIYQLSNLLTRKTFQPNGTIAESAALEEQPLAQGTGNQLYEFIPVGKDVYLIRLKATEWYLTPSDPDGKINSAIVLAKKKNTTDQRWQIYTQEPTM